MHAQSRSTAVSDKAERARASPCASGSRCSRPRRPGQQGLCALATPAGQVPHRGTRAMFP